MMIKKIVSQRRNSLRTLALDACNEKIVGLHSCLNLFSLGHALSVRLMVHPLVRWSFGPWSESKSGKTTFLDTFCVFVCGRGGG